MWLPSGDHAIPPTPCGSSSRRPLPSGRVTINPARPMKAIRSPRGDQVASYTSPVSDLPRASSNAWVPSGLLSTIADESSPQSWSPATKATRSYVIRVPSGDQRGSFPAAMRRMPPRTTSSVTTVTPPQSASYVVYEVRRCLPSGDHWSGPTDKAPAGARASQRRAAPSARTTQTPSRSPWSPTYAICLPSGENDGSAPGPMPRLSRPSSPAVTSCGGASSGHCAPTTMSPLAGALSERRLLRPADASALVATPIAATAKAAANRMTLRSSTVRTLSLGCYDGVVPLQGFHEPALSVPVAVASRERCRSTTTG